MSALLLPCLLAWLLEITKVTEGISYLLLRLEGLLLLGLLEWLECLLLRECLLLLLRLEWLLYLSLLRLLELLEVAKVILITLIMR